MSRLWSRLLNHPRPLHFDTMVSSDSYVYSRECLWWIALLPTLLSCFRSYWYCHYSPTSARRISFMTPPCPPHLLCGFYHSSVWGHLPLVLGRKCFEGENTSLSYLIGRKGKVDVQTPDIQRAQLLLPPKTQPFHVRPVKSSMGS